MNTTLDFLKEKYCYYIAHKNKFSPREAEVFKHTIEGKSSKEICNKLFIAEKTVKYHLTNIYRKCGINSRHKLHWILELAWPLPENSEEFDSYLIKINENLQRKKSLPLPENSNFPYK